MSTPGGPRVDCLLIGEYVDEGEVPPNLQTHRGEVVRSEVIGAFVDDAGKPVAIQEFTVLLKDNRTVIVRGHCLKHFPPTPSGENGSYGVIVRVGSEELLVGLFHMVDVVGIFNGEIRSDRKIA
jgi:hypothetical protein